VNGLMNRRRFLTALGMGAGAGLVGRTARAATGDVPKRLVMVSTCHGTVYDHWRMRPAGAGPEGSPWVADLVDLPEEQWSRGLQPLYAHRRRLNVLDGISMVTAELDIDGYRHEKGWIHAWTGDWVSFTGSRLFATKPSLDQVVANEIARADHIRSLELAIGESRPVAHFGLHAELPVTRDPQQVYDRLFGLSNSDDPLLKASGSILDFAAAERDALAPKLSRADRSRLADHFDLVRQLEQRVAGLQASSCEGPDRASLRVSLEDYDADFDAMTQLIGAAFSCDLTRVVSMSLGDLPSAEFGWGDFLSGDVHNDIAHRIYDDPTAAEGMGEYQHHHSLQLARLVAALEAIPEGDGTMMDHTLIVVGGELGDGWHGYRHFYMATLGGDWAWEGGRYRSFPWDSTDVAMVDPLGAPRCGLPHQHVLVSAARAMGLRVDRLGLEGVQTDKGDYLSLRGGLPGMEVSL